MPSPLVTLVARASSTRSTAGAGSMSAQLAVRSSGKSERVSCAGCRSRRLYFVRARSPVMSGLSSRSRPIRAGCLPKPRSSASLRSSSSRSTATGAIWPNPDDSGFRSLSSGPSRRRCRLARTTPSTWPSVLHHLASSRRRARKFSSSGGPTSIGCRRSVPSRSG